MILDATWRSEQGLTWIWPIRGRQSKIVYIKFDGHSARGLSNQPNAVCNQLLSDEKLKENEKKKDEHKKLEKKNSQVAEIEISSCSIHDWRSGTHASYIWRRLEKFYEI